MTIPVLDASIFARGSQLQRSQLAKDLLASCSRYGFVKIINHGIPDEMISELFNWTEKLFKISLESKAKIAHPPGPEPQRGWSCVGAESTAKLYSSKIGKTDTSLNLTDAREHFDQGASTDLNWPNRWPSEGDLPGFRSFMEHYYSLCQQVSDDILNMLEAALKLPPGSFTSKCTGEASELRLNHYPAIDIKEIRHGSVARIWPHTDLGVITCLFQDGIGGLEVADGNKPGAFVPVSTGSPSEMVVNISETLQRWTNGKLQAGVHQVTIPANLKHLHDGVIPARYSNAFFVKADRDAFVGVLDQFFSEKAPALYDNISALQYHQRRLATAYGIDHTK